MQAKREDSFETTVKMPQEKRLRVTTASRLDTKEEVGNIGTKTMQSLYDRRVERKNAAAISTTSTFLALQNKNKANVRNHNTQIIIICITSLILFPY
jgi:hypothetical protein